MPSYKDAGVDIDAADELIARIKPFAARTKRKEVRGSLGGFSALCEIPKSYQRPLLVSSTDGVGTKLKLAIDTGLYHQIGIDLVAMCVNDLIVCGAEPLFFLDYYATGKLNVDVAASIIESIAEGCVQSGAALIGGETAEMPGLYHGDDIDLAGFSVGVVEADAVIEGEKVAAGDVVLGLASSGVHSNGFALVRRILAKQTQVSPETIQALMIPTRIYVAAIRAVLQAKLPIHAMAHITGGGVIENIPRVLPKNIQVQIKQDAWPRPDIFKWLQEKGEIAGHEMWRTFNCGIGMVLIVPAHRAAEAKTILAAHGETVYTIGHTAACHENDPAVVLS